MEFFSYIAAYIFLIVLVPIALQDNAMTMVPPGNCPIRKITTNKEPAAPSIKSLISCTPYFILRQNLINLIFHASIR